MRNISRTLLAVIAIQLALVDGAYPQDGLRDKDIEFSQNWLEQVRVGVSDENLLGAAIVARLHDETLASTLLTRALESLEHDPLLLSTAVQSCFSASPLTLCQDNSLFEALIQVDQDNLEPYLYLMLRLVETGNAALALETLNSGMAADHHDIYYHAKARFLEAQLLSAGYPPEEASYPAAVYADASANYSLFLKVLSTCTTRSSANEDWKLSCLFLGARLQHTSQDLMSNVFGGAIQRDVLRAVGADADVVQLIVEHNEWINKARDLANEKVAWMSPSSTTLDQPESFIREKTGVTEFEAILRAIYRTQ